MTEKAAAGARPGPPRWAWEAARSELEDAAEDLVRSRAWQLVNERTTLDDERHDEFDDADRGGEG